LKILISNDDGINSLGIAALADELKKIGEITVVAPMTEQSAIGHAITMKYPLRVTEHYKNGEFFGYAVDGTPADCIKIGIRNLMKEPPDIVLSGNAAVFHKTMTQEEASAVLGISPHASAEARRVAVKTADYCLTKAREAKRQAHPTLFGTLAERYLEWAEVHRPRSIKFRVTGAGRHTLRRKRFTSIDIHPAPQGIPSPTDETALAPIPVESQRQEPRF